MTNPYQVAWWVTAGLSFIGAFGLESVAGLFTAIIIWITAFPIAIHLGRRYGGGTAFTIIKITSALAILGFSAYFIYVGIARVLG